MPSLQALQEPEEEQAVQPASAELQHRPCLQEPERQLESLAQAAPFSERAMH